MSLPKVDMKKFDALHTIHQRDPTVWVVARLLSRKSKLEAVEEMKGQLKAIDKMALPPDDSTPLLKREQARLEEQLFEEVLKTGGNITSATLPLMINTAYRISSAETLIARVPGWRKKLLGHLQMSERNKLAKDITRLTQDIDRLTEQLTFSWEKMDDPAQEYYSSHTRSEDGTDMVLEAVFGERVAFMSPRAVELLIHLGLHIHQAQTDKIKQERLINRQNGEVRDHG